MGCIVPYRRKCGHFVTFAVVPLNSKQGTLFSDSLNEYATGAILTNGYYNSIRVYNNISHPLRRSLLVCTCIALAFCRSPGFLSQRFTTKMTSTGRQMKQR
jgi:hypothetical protein